MGIKYCLTMTPEQAKAANSAIELMMRLKLAQYGELPYTLMDISDKEYCEKRDNAMPHLKAGFDAMFRGRTHSDTDWKDREWYVLYNLHQVIRHAIRNAEFPDSNSVWATPPMDFEGIGLPEIETVREGKNELER